MGPRLILSNAQKSTGTHAPTSAGSVPSSRNKFEVAAKGGTTAEGIIQVRRPVDYSVQAAPTLTQLTQQPS